MTPLVHDRVMRGVDVVVAGVLLVVTAPVLAAVALAVRLGLGRRVMFRQVRAGRHGVPFTMHKFRTMLDEVGPDGRVRSEEERIPALGAFLRAASLDELPQLFDVLRGRMALVGPRPLYLEYVPLYTPEQARRLLVRPGITGLAQVSGRNALGWEEKLTLDTHYVDHRSLRLDLRILGLTFLRVVRPTGITEDGHPTSTMFTGSQPADGATGGTVPSGTAPGSSTSGNSTSSTSRGSTSVAGG